MKNTHSTVNHYLSGAIILSFVLIILSACAGTETNSKILPRSTPEAEGVSSHAIFNFLEAVDSSGLELHSFMFLRHGKVIAEGWWEPFEPELKHILYSTSKSFTSTAIGFAVDEGLLTVKDKVISFFPDDLPEIVSPNLADMAVEDLLSMSAGQDPEPTFSLLLPSDNWVKAFLSAEVVHEPGSKFLYNSAATYMLSAIITRQSGKTVLEYLTPRLFKPLGIEDMDWEVDPNGINVGGWGLRLKTEDMAKFGQLYLQKGRWNGKQILPGKWVAEATTKKIDQAPELSEAERANSDWLQGYCYKFWRSRHNSYRADGAYGQYIIIMPEKDVVIAITASVGDMQKEINLVWDHLLPGISDQALAADEIAHGQLQSKLDNLHIPPPKSDADPSLEMEISGNTYEFKDEGSGEKEEYKITFLDHKCLLEHRTAEDLEYNFLFGMHSWEIGETNKASVNLLPQPHENLLQMLPFKVACSYTWEDRNTLKLFIKYIEGPHTESLKFIFKGDEVSLHETGARIQSNDAPLKHGNLVEVRK